MYNSKLDVKIEQDYLLLQSEEYGIDKSVNLSELIFNRIYDTEINLPEEEYYHLHYLEEIIINEVKCWLLVYTKALTTKCLLAGQKTLAKTLMQYKATCIKAFINEKGLSVEWVGGITNKFSLNLTDVYFKVDEIGCSEFEMPVAKKSVDLSKTFFRRTFFVPMDLLIHNDTVVNTRCMISFNANGIPFSMPIMMEDDNITDSKEYYIPMSHVQTANQMMYLRRTSNASLTLVRRPLEDIEKTFFFKQMESDNNSQKMYEKGKKIRECGNDKIVLFYEKFASKAEEGTFELFEKALKYNPNCYYIITKDSPDYRRIRFHKNVIAKFSRKYYKILYRASVLIGTEAPQHVHIIRGSNPYVKKVLHHANFVFLQHGIMFCSDISGSTILSKGKEFEPDYVCISSEKEKRGISASLQLDEEKMICSGIPVFDTLQYKHIRQNSDDKVLLMLTWRPADASLTNFEDSYNFIKTKEVYELLKKYIPAENIMVIAHPLIADKMKKTSLSDSLYLGPMSEALRKSKLLITDFSSIAYNVFYQGGAVLYYQEPAYMDRQFIPHDDEWIGYRAFSIDDIKAHLQKGVDHGTIHLDYFRSRTFEEIYNTINEFSDGKNADRLIQYLLENHILI